MLDFSDTIDLPFPTPGPRSGLVLIHGLLENEATCYRLSSAPLSSSTPALPPAIRGKIVVHETDPWCQKGWELLPEILKSWL